MKLSDYVIWRVAQEVRHVFMLAGGGCMHLVDSVGRCRDIEYVCNLHEQASLLQQMPTANTQIILVLR